MRPGTKGKLGNNCSGLVPMDNLPARWSRYLRWLFNTFFSGWNSDKTICYTIHLSCSSFLPFQCTGSSIFQICHWRCAVHAVLMNRKIKLLFCSPTYTDSSVPVILRASITPASSLCPPDTSSALTDRDGAASADWKPDAIPPYNWWRNIIYIQAVLENIWIDDRNFCP